MHLFSKYLHGDFSHGIILCWGYGFINSIRIWVSNAVDEEKQGRGIGRVSRDERRMDCSHE